VSTPSPSTTGTRYDPYDLVGSRVLVGVQMVDISRLSAHPVPLTNGGLITVAGQGPKDSNGAGKSSFIAALSLLHADEQWRLAGGAPGAAELLFTAELAAQEARWANADRGYVIGVFADPRARTPSELQDGALTVWLRINRKSPYLSLRWRQGLYVPYGANDAERAAGVHDLWNALPSSNGRDDFHAGRLSSVLYGGQVRCVSFLSTSVRSSPAANLLAQPLNELSPARIFDAVATLTGLDRELEQEQALRSGEHARRIDVQEAEQDLAGWQREMEGVERGIASRGVARDLLLSARQAWRSRAARHLVDGVQEVGRLREALANLATSRQQMREALQENEERIADLSNDEEFEARFKTTQDAWAVLREQATEADTRQRVTLARLEDLTSTLREARSAARAADDRSLETARFELAAAEETVEAQLSARGAATGAVTRAAEQLAAARTGDDVATEQLQVLQAAGIPAATVLDTLILTQAQRSAWEPRLVPYRGAVTVPKAYSGAARAALAELAGSLLILADGEQPAPGLPQSAGAEFGLGTFLAALAERASSSSKARNVENIEDVDPGAAVVVIGGFDSPVTGRVARIEAAQQQHTIATEALAQLNTALTRARNQVATARARLDGALAAEQAEQLGHDIDGLRDLSSQLQEDHEQLRIPLQDAESAHAVALGDRQARQDKIKALRAEGSRIREEQRKAQELGARWDTDLIEVDLDARAIAWGETSGAAEHHLLTLPEDEQKRTTADWNGEACHSLEDVVRRCFPDGTPAQELPAELRALLVEQRWARLPLEARILLVPDLIRALQTHLDLTAQQDTHDQMTIDQQRAARHLDLDAARSGLEESKQATHAHRSVLAQGIAAKLKLVADEFDRLDREYGGYGAGLDYPEPEPPTEPDKPWRWSVTPKWRRAESQRMSGYNLRANTAQMDEKAVKLVCAAALAGGNDRPLLLILDELGRNLGKQHRREAVALFERIGRDRNITVIGALQDDMERYAIEASNLYIKLRRSSDAVAYNDAPVVQGDDANQAMVELLQNWMASFRPDWDGVVDLRDGEPEPDLLDSMLASQPAGQSPER
jgi:chromosome segregation protein